MRKFGVLYKADCKWPQSKAGSNSAMVILLRDVLLKMDTFQKASQHLWRPSESLFAMTNAFCNQNTSLGEGGRGTGAELYMNKKKRKKRKEYKQIHVFYNKIRPSWKAKYLQNKQIKIKQQQWFLFLYPLYLLLTILQIFLLWQNIQLTVERSDKLDIR